LGTALAEEERARREFLETFDEPAENFAIGCDLTRNGKADLPETARYIRCRQAYQERIRITDMVIAEIQAQNQNHKREEVA
jgi:hypothetical protein